MPTGLKKTNLAADVAKAKIVHPVNMMRFFLPLIATAEASGESSHQLLRYLHEEIASQLTKYQDDSRANLSDDPTFRTSEMLDRLANFIEKSSDKDGDSCSPWRGLNNSALDLLRGIQNPLFREPQVPTVGKDEQEAKERPSNGQTDSTNWNWIHAKLPCQFKPSLSREERASDEALLNEFKTRLTTGIIPLDLDNITTVKPQLPNVQIVRPPWNPVEPVEVKKMGLRIKVKLHPGEVVSKEHEVPEVPDGLESTMATEKTALRQATRNPVQPPKEPPREGEPGPGSSSSVAQDTVSFPAATSNQNNENIHLQLAERLVGQLSSSYCLQRAHGLAVEGRTLYIMIVDRSGVIISEGINIIKHLPLYLAFLFIFQRLKEADWGIHPLLEHPTFEMDGVKFTRTHVFLHKPQERLGQMSTVRQYIYQKNQKNGGTYDAAVKFSWPHADQSPEGDNLIRAHKKFCETDINYNVCGHTPLVLAYMRDESTRTDIIRKAMGCDVERPRLLSILVVPHYRGTITNLYGQKYEQVLIDCLHAHYALWQFGIRHGDISDANLLYRYLCHEEKLQFQQDYPGENPDDQVVGVLCDFDRTVERKQINHELEPTGTRCFTSARLLNFYKLSRGPLVHQYLDDLESFMWVIVIDTALYPRSETLNFWLTFKLRQWGTTTDLAGLGSEKADWIRQERSLVIHPVTERHRGTWARLLWLVTLVKKIRNDEEIEGKKIANVGDSDQDIEAHDRKVAEGYYKQVLAGQEEENRSRDV